MAWSPLSSFAINMPVNVKAPAHDGLSLEKMPAQSTLTTSLF